MKVKTCAWCGGKEKLIDWGPYWNNPPCCAWCYEYKARHGVRPIYWRLVWFRFKELMKQLTGLFARYK